MSADLTPERWRQISALLDVLLELPSDERADLLARFFPCHGGHSMPDAVAML